MIKYFIQKLLSFLKGFWNLYGALLISTFVSWLYDWNANQLIAVNQYIGMSISIMCLLTMVKCFICPMNKVKKPKKNIVEKAVMSTKVCKNTTLTINTINNLQTEALQNMNMKGGIRMIKFFKTYKGVITSTVILIATIIIQVTDTLYGVLGDAFVVGGINILTIIGYIASTVIGIVSYGLGSPKLKEQIAILKDQCNGDTTDLTNISDIKYLEKQIDTYEKTIQKLNKNYEKVISEVERCVRLNLAMPANVQEEYHKYLDEYNSKTDALNVYKERLNNLKSNIVVQN